MKSKDSAKARIKTKGSEEIPLKRIAKGKENKKKNNEPINVFFLLHQILVFPSLPKIVEAASPNPIHESETRTKDFSGTKQTNSNAPIR